MLLVLVFAHALVIRLTNRRKQDIKYPTDNLLAMKGRSRKILKTGIDYLDSLVGSSTPHLTLTVYQSDVFYWSNANRTVGKCYWHQSGCYSQSSCMQGPACMYLYPDI